MDEAAIDSPALLAQAQSGDGESYCQLCAPLEARLVQQAYVLCRDWALAEDLAQETLVEAWKSLERYDGTCQLFTWFCSILFHRHRSALRRRRFRFFVAEERSGAEADLAETATPDENAANDERSRHILACVARLPRKQREVVWLRFYADESLEGIAVALECSVGTVKSRLFHALGNLRRMRALREVIE